MGGGIAAHLANLGFDVSLLDATQQDAINGLERVRQARPPAFYVPEKAGEIRIGNVIDDIHLVQEADWVCEAIVEQPLAKQALFARIEPLLKPTAIVSSNTSGIPLSLLVEGRTPEFARRFLGVHFFNPPRYLKLIELIPGDFTDTDVVKFMVEFLEHQAGRRVVVAKDTPGFIANRYGMWCLYHAIRVAEKLGFAVEDVDAITGPFLGRPKTGTFRLADVIGLDVMRDIGQQLMEKKPDDPFISTFELPSSVLSLLARGWIGDKSGHGYYEREGKEVLVLDLTTFAYRMQRPTTFADLARLSAMPLGPRIRETLQLKSEVGEFAREFLIPTLRYAHTLAEEISHSVHDFDRVMKWGFGWEKGPFELIDEIGADQLGVPLSEPFYKGDMVRQFSGQYSLPRSDPQFKPLSDYQEIAGGETFKLRDLGNGVIAIVITTKMGMITPLLVKELTEVFEAEVKHYVLTSEARSFSAGFNLNFFAKSIAAADFGSIEAELLALQRLGELMEKVPGAAAVYGHCLGAGLELALSTSTILAAAETQIGLPESRVGLIPGGRGVTLMKQNNSFNAKRIAEVTVSMTLGTVAGNADMARQIGYLRSTDKTVYGPDQLIFLAKQAALDAQPKDRTVWTAPVGPLSGMIDEHFAKLRASGTLTEYDEIIGGKLRQIVARSTSYDDALARERTEFIDLCGRNLTQQRIRHMLESGRPAKN